MNPVLPDHCLKMQSDSWVINILLRSLTQYLIRSEIIQMCVERAAPPTHNLSVMQKQTYNLAIKLMLDILICCPVTLCWFNLPTLCRLLGSDQQNYLSINSWEYWVTSSTFLYQLSNNNVVFSIAIDSFLGQNIAYGLC